MQISPNALPALEPMPLTGAQRKLLIGMRIFLALLSLVAVYDFLSAL